MRYYWLVLILVSGASCNIGPRATGDAGTELVYLVPGDRIILPTGDQGYVDADGFLRGIRNANVQAAGRKARDVIEELSLHVYCDRYQVIHAGKREIEVRGSVKHPGTYSYPKDEDWNIMNLMLKVEGFLPGSESKEYLLVRKSWEFPGSSIFIRGEAMPSLMGIGGDALQIYAGDLIIFPGTDSIIYIFGSVKDRAECFTFTSKNPPVLKIAIEKAGGNSSIADLTNINVYRVLRDSKRSIFTLNFDSDHDFVLEPWDIVYIPPKIPKDLVK